MRISDWSSDVCSSDLQRQQRAEIAQRAAQLAQIYGEFLAPRHRPGAPHPVTAPPGIGLKRQCPASPDRPPPVSTQRPTASRLKGVVLTPEELRVGTQGVSTCRFMRAR